ncbi:tetratricopeptide repeat protein, partial [Frateuria defendens]|uniref:tetratricopeptide repeat protein n=1 Tax=Frateuria defendens TaxID=2219559 RepID=UPI00066FF9A3
GHAPGAAAQYNLGNALAKAGRYREALDAYDRALKLDPHDADAGANRQAVADWLKRQPPKPSPAPKQGGGKGQPSQGKDGAGQDAQQDGTPGHGQEGKSGDAPPSQNPNGEPGHPQGGDAAKQDGAPGNGSPHEAGMRPPSAEEQAAQQARAAQAQQALKQQMDRSLAADGKAPPAEAVHQLGLPGKDDPQAKLPADVRQALQRVPDDPGGLLRRKFELEYRQRHGEVPAEDESP